MGIEFINGQLNLPAFMIKTNQVTGGIAAGIESGGQQPVDNEIAWSLRVVEGVFNDPDRHALSGRATLGIVHRQMAQVGAIG